MASKTENRRVNIYINDKSALDSGKAIRSEFYKARAALDAAKKGTDNYRDSLKRLKEAERVLQEHKKSITNVSKGWQNFKTIAAGVIGANLIQGAMQKLGQFLTSMVSGAAKLSDAFSDVQKTTGLTKNEVSELNSEFKEFNTRTARLELLALAKEAGRLGVKGKDNIKAFVKEANQINVALGEDLGEGAVLKIGKMAAAFDTSMLKIGSAINEVGANSKAQEQYMVDFTSRMQGIAVAAGIGAPDIIGYAATLDSLGLQAEMSATALNTFFIDFVKNTKKFGDAAGFANGELQELIGKEGTNAGFVAFLEKLKASTSSTAEFLQKLSDLGVDGARGSQVFLSLSNNIGEVQKMQDLSNAAFEKGTSLTDEYNIKNNNLAASLEKVQKWIYGIFVNGAVMKGIEKVVNLFADWISIPLSETLQKEAMDLRVLELQIYDTNTPAEDRIKLIEKLKEQYPDYLKNINAETVSNQELHDSLQAVNDMLLNKIIIQRKQEVIDAQAEDRADAFEKLQEKKVKLSERLLLVAKRNQIELSLEGTTVEKATKLYDELNKKRAASGGVGESSEMNGLRFLTQYASQAKKEFDALSAEGLKLTEQMGALKKELFGDTVDSVVPSNTSGGNSGVSASGIGLSEEEQKALDKKKKEFLKAEADLQRALEDLRIANLADEEQRAIDKRVLDYERRQVEIAESVASEATKNEALKEEKIAFETDIDAINLEFENKRKEKATKEEEAKALGDIEVYRALMSERQLEILDAENHYDRLIELAGENANQIIALEKKKTEILQDINEKHDKIVTDAQINLVKTQTELVAQKWEQTISFANGAVNAINGMMSFMGESAENMSDFQKATIIFQMGINMAAAISAATAAGAADPKNAVTFGASGLATFGIIMGMIVNNMALANQLIAKDKSPQFNDMSAPQFGMGGVPDGPLHSNGGLPVINPRTGNVEYVMEGGEPILSRATYANNKGLVNSLLNSGGKQIDFSFLNAANQPGVNFGGFNSSLGGQSATGAGLNADEVGRAVAKALAPIYSELAKVKEKPAVVSLTSMKDAQKDLDSVRRLSGFKN